MSGVTCGHCGALELGGGLNHLPWCVALPADPLTEQRQAAGEGILTATRAGLIEWHEEISAPVRRVFFTANHKGVHLWLTNDSIRIDDEMVIPIPVGLREAVIGQQATFGAALLDEVASWGDS
jgi:hypothetical protein